MTGIHWPLRHRINGDLVNLTEFVEACRAGQVVYREPADTCRIWETVLG